MKARMVITLFALLLLLIGISALARAQSGDLMLVWHAVNASAGRGAGGDLTLAGAIGHWSGATTQGGDLRQRADFLGPRGTGDVDPPPPPPPPPPNLLSQSYVPFIVR